MKKTDQLEQVMFYNRHPSLLSSTLDDVVVILGIESGKYYQMNTVGSRIWEILEQPVTLEDIKTILLNEFNVTDEQCQESVADFICYLKSRKLIEETVAG